MDMDNRKRLIREVLDEDMNINRQVTNITMQKVMGIPEEVSPYIQLNEEEINKMSTNASVLRQVLEKKFLVSEQAVNNEDGRPPGNAQVVDLGHIEEVWQAYNNVLTVYLNPRNTQETISYISRILVAFEGIVNRLTGNIEIMMRRMRTMRRPHLELLIHAYALYELIRRQLTNADFYIIRANDIRVGYTQRLRDRGPAVPAAAPVVAPGGGPGGGGPGGDGPGGDGPGGGPIDDGSSDGEDGPAPGGGPGPVVDPREDVRGPDPPPPPRQDYNSDRFVTGDEGSIVDFDFDRDRTPMRRPDMGSAHGLPPGTTPRYAPDFQEHYLFGQSEDDDSAPGGASASHDMRFNFRLGNAKKGSVGPRPTLVDMHAAIKKYNSQRHHKLEPSDAIRNNNVELQKYLHPYIRFLSPSGEEIALQGAGMDGIEETSGDEMQPAPVEPVVPYHDVRNDPYFVVR